MAKNNETPVQEVPEPPEAKTDEQPEAQSDGELIELEHFLHDGTMFIGETAYNIVGGKVKVAKEHLQQALDHIKMGG